MDFRPGASAPEERSQANWENIAAHPWQHGAASLRCCGSPPGQTRYTGATWSSHDQKTNSISSEHENLIRCTSSDLGHMQEQTHAST